MGPQSCGPMFDWNDLRPFLAIARHGSSTAAARALGLDQSTVQRRLAALESRVGQPLVERRSTGYVLTEYGRELLPLAQQVESDIARLEEHIRRSSRELNGVLRLTCPEPIVARMTASSLLADLRACHPGLRIEFVMSDSYVDFRNGEVDVALRSGDTTDNALVGRKLADSFWAVYACHEYVARHGAPASLREALTHPWVTLDAGMAQHRASTWLREAAPRVVIAATSGSVLGMLQSVKAGVGIGVLPTALGDHDQGLRRLFGPVPELTREWRILTTPQLRRTARVSAFFDFMVQEKDAVRRVLTG
jgi:molybdate transport repressor ModE-like protein